MHFFINQYSIRYEKQPPAYLETYLQHATVVI